MRCGGNLPTHQLRANTFASCDQIKELFNPDFFPLKILCNERLPRKWGNWVHRAGWGSSYSEDGKSQGGIRYHVLPVFPTWGGSVPIQQVVIFGGVKVHDNTGSIKQLLVTAGTGDAVVTVPAVSSVIQLLRLHLAMHPSPG